MRSLFILTLAGIAQFLLLLRVATWGRNLLAAAPASLLVIAAAGIPYLAAAYLVSVRRSLDRPATLVLLFIAGVAVRLVLLPGIPVLSDDIFRYLWDGRVQLNGTNPFTYAPNDPALAGLRDEWYTRINHPDISTIYPPTAQIVSLVSSFVWHHPIMLKLLLVGFDLATAWLVVLILRRRGMPAARVVWYLWNPLLIVETAHSGHVDVVAVFFVALTFLLVERNRHTGAWVSLAFAFMAKLYPLFLAPTIRRRGEWRGPLVFLGVSAALIVPYIGAGSGLFIGLTAFTGGWRFNDSLFGLVALLMPDGRAAAFLKPYLLPLLGPYGVSTLPATFLPATRVTVVALFVAVLVWVARCEWSLEAKVTGVLGALLLLSPAVFPWYAVMLLPWLPLLDRAHAARTVVALWTVLLPLTYWTLPEFSARGVWLDVPLWLRCIEYGLPLAAGAVVLHRERIRARGDRGSGLSPHRSSGSGKGMDSLTAPAHHQPP